MTVDKLPYALGGMNFLNTSSENANKYVDLGASSHMSNNSSNLSNLRDYFGPNKIIMKNSSKLYITYVGNITRSGLKLQKVLVVPKITKNLHSLSKTEKYNSCTVIFDESDFFV